MIPDHLSHPSDKSTKCQAASILEAELFVYRRADLLMDAPVFLLTVNRAITDNLTARTLHQNLLTFFFCSTTSTLFFLLLGSRGRPIFVQFRESLLVRRDYLLAKQLHPF
jgi:hypothetical protein